MNGSFFCVGDHVIFCCNEFLVRWNDEWFNDENVLPSVMMTCLCVPWGFNPSDAKATYTTLCYPSRVASGRGLQLVHRHRFLFQRFKSERYYYGTLPKNSAIEAIEQCMNCMNCNKWVMDIDMEITFFLCLVINKISFFSKFVQTNIGYAHRRLPAPRSIACFRSFASLAEFLGILARHGTRNWIHSNHGENQKPKTPPKTNMDNTPKMTPCLKLEIQLKKNIILGIYVRFSWGVLAVRFREGSPWVGAWDEFFPIEE